MGSSQVKSMYKRYVTFNTEGDLEVYSFPKISESDVDENWYLADNPFIKKRLKSLTGKVLTLIDAAIADGRQNKAFKDVIKNEFMSELCFIDEQMYKGQLRELEDNEVPTPVSADEVLKED